METFDPLLYWLSATLFFVCLYMQCVSHWAVQVWISLRAATNCRVRYGGLDSAAGSRVFFFFFKENLAKQIVQSHEEIMSTYTELRGLFDVTWGKRE